MQAVQFEISCFNCLKTAGWDSKMRYIGNGTYHCDVCKNTKQLDGHIGRNPLVLLSGLGFSIPLLQTTLPLLQSMTPEIQMVGGLFLFVGYMVMGVKALTRI